MEWTVSDVDQGYYWIILVDGDVMLRQHPIPFTDRREAVRGAERLNKRDFG